MGFAERFKRAQELLKARHGSGDYSWAEGLNRKIARRIARDVTRAEMRGAKADRASNL